MQAVGVLRQLEEPRTWPHRQRQSLFEDSARVVEALRTFSPDFSGKGRARDREGATRVVLR